MKIYLMTDMEGVCGVVNHDDWVLPTGRYYDAGRELLTLEINAALEGFFAEGADEVLVMDGHGAGGVNHLLLDPRALFQRGIIGPYPFGLDGSFDAMAWVGQHAKAGTPFAHIAHTGWFNVLDYTINGVSVGEFGQLAMLGAGFGIRPLFGAGDEAFTREAAALVPGIEAVAVKRGLTPGSGDEYDTEGYRSRNLAAIHLHPQKARERIREGAARALRRFKAQPESFPMPPVQAPYKRIVRYRADGGRPAHTARAEHESDLAAMMNAPDVPLP